MSISLVVRQIGPTVALSVTAASTTAVTVSSASNEPLNFCSFLNTGATVIAVNCDPGAITAPAAVLPVAGTPQTMIMLPASMPLPVIYAVPGGQNNTISVTAIGSGAGPSLVYITPVAAQS